MKKTAFYTLGCRANQAQTESLKSENQEIVKFTEFADEYIINTCTVTHDAERKSRQAIRRAIRQNPNAKITITGCFAKLEKGKLKKLFPKASIIDPVSLAPRISHITPRVRANLMIQDGCEHFCTYCIVPYARGKIQSKSLDQIEIEAKQLVNAGAREIILTGINLGTYQLGLDKVIEILGSIENLYRIRLSSLEPMYINKELIDKISCSPKVCKHLHIPLQSGDNKTLSTMKRKYTTDNYLDLIKK